MIDIESYLKEITPVNVLDITKMEVLKNILNGYSYALESGITVIYTENIHAELSSLNRIDALDGEALRTYQKICAHWRDSNECSMDKFCSNCDNNEAFIYFENKWEGLRIFRCKPLSLWEMTYPITINKHIVGVLFAGQMVVNHGRFNWKEELEKISLEKHIDWETIISEEDNHLETVKQQIILKKEISQKQKEKLLELLNENNPKQIEKFTLLGIDDFKKRIQKFVDFGKMMQDLMVEMNNAKKESASHQLIGQFSNRFDTINYSEYDQYWKDFASILNTLKKIPGINSVDLYTRERSRYIRNIPEDKTKEANLFTSDVIQTFDAKKFILINPAMDDNSINKLEDGRLQIYGYRSDTGFGRELCSTLIILKGNLSGEHDALIEKICEITCITSNLALMIYRERENDKNYQRHVSNIGHSFRTPLQALSLVLEDLKLQAVSNQLQIANEIKYALDRIKDAKEDLEILLEPTSKNEDTIDFIATMNYLVCYMKPMADKQPCRLVKQGDWPKNILIKGNKYEIERAIINLLDNAIKYSFGGKAHNAPTGYYEVRISITVENNIVVLFIQNYGVGIPPEKINNIREYNLRGNVADKKKSRLGLGLGLPYAIEIIEKEGGWLEINSIPVNNATEEDIKKFLRYITTVKVSLPVQKNKLQNLKDNE